MIEPTEQAFFKLSGDLVIGNDPARGPWSADACHAGPATAVVARAVEQVVADKQLVRLTVTFQRPIPMSGFRVQAAPERSGRNAATATATLKTEDGRICAIASSLHLATGVGGDLPTASIVAPNLSDATPGAFPVGTAMHGLPFFSSGIEVAYPPGETPELGPTTVWMRTLPIVEGESASPFQSLCPLADCGNGISRNATFAEATFLNPDLTVAVFRVPASEWLASSAISFWEPTGLGLSQAQLYDTEGAIGYALQTLLIKPIDSPGQK